MSRLPLTTSSIPNSGLIVIPFQSQGFWLNLSDPWKRLLLVMFGLACTVVVLSGIKAVANVLNPVLMAGFLALLLQPLLDRLRRFRGLGVAIIVLAVVVGGLGLVGFIGVSMRQLALELPRYQDEFNALIATLAEQFAERGIDAGTYLESVLTGPAIGRMVLNVSSAIATTFGSLILTLFIFAFMLGGMWEMERRANRDAQDHSPLAARFLEFSTTIRGYMGVRTILGLGTAALNYVLLIVLGVDHALLWAVLSFLLSFVPNIGFALSMLPPMLLALLAQGWLTALFVFVGYQVINNLLDNVIGPRFIGRQMKISALLSFLSVIFWTWLLGASGAILAVPLTVLVMDLAFGPRADEKAGSPAPAGPSSIPTPS